MNKENIVTLKSPYRDDFQINGYRFGKGEKTCCIVGAMRGNEVQQLYVCSQIIRALSNIEKKGDLVYGKQIMVIPSLNPFSMNIHTENSRRHIRFYKGISVRHSVYLILYFR